MDCVSIKILLNECDSEEQKEKLSRTIAFLGKEVVRQDNQTNITKVHHKNK